MLLALLCEQPADAVLVAQRASHRSMMRDLTARKSGAGLADTLALDFALFHLEADLRWLDHTSARLDRLAEEIA